MIKAAIKSIIFVTTLSVSGLCIASGFQLWEQDSAGIGDNHAGAAVDTRNTGIEFYNPAGMVFMQDPRIQASAGAAYIPLDVKFDGQTTDSFGGVPQTLNHTNGWLDGGTNNLIPNFHFIAPIGNKWAVGFGVTTPFGLSTDYGTKNNPVSDAATKTDLITINLNPNIAYKVTPWLSLGAGADLEYGSAEFDMVAPLANLPVNNQLSDWAWGWNAGVYLKPTHSTDIGIAYRSAITHQAKGTAKSKDINTNKNIQSSITATLPLPATLTISADQHIGNKFTLLASAERTWWDSFSALTIKNVVNPLGQGNFNLSVPFDYSNTWNIAVGAHYQISRVVSLEAGGGFDFTPTNNKDRDIRLPGTNRWAISAGAHLDLGHHMTMDGGWIHLIPTGNAKIDNNGPHNNMVETKTTGTAKTTANVFGLQLTALL